MNRGQIFSIDFLIAMILMIFFLGLLLSLGELQGYERKEERIRYELQSKTEAALITLFNSPEYSCEMENGSFLAYSIDYQKLFPTDHQELKARLGLADYNFSFSLDGTQIITHYEDYIGKNAIVIDTQFLYCIGTISFTDLNNCINGACGGTLAKKTLTLKVSK